MTIREMIKTCCSDCIIEIRDNGYKVTRFRLGKWLGKYEKISDELLDKEVAYWFVRGSIARPRVIINFRDRVR